MENKWGMHHPEASGKISEVFPFGQVDIKNLEYVKGLKTCTAFTEGSEERKRCSIDLIKKHQPFDSENPKKKFLSDLLKYVKEEAGFKEKDKKVSAFTTVGSIADVEQGIDLFIEISGEGMQHPVYITYDGTIERGKVNGERTKADVLVDFNEIPDPNEEPEEYAEKMRYLGRMSAMVYRSRLPKESPASPTKPRIIRRGGPIIDSRGRINLTP